MIKWSDPNENWRFRFCYSSPSHSLSPSPATPNYKHRSNDESLRSKRISVLWLNKMKRAKNANYFEIDQIFIEMKCCVCAVAPLIVCEKELAGIYGVSVLRSFGRVEPFLCKATQLIKLLDALIALCKPDA